MNENYPKHVAVIMDVNGRWAKARGLPRIQGHKAGAESVRRLLRGARKFGIRWLTLYAFSIENWSRPEAEVSGLMRLLTTFLAQNRKVLDEEQIRLRISGRRSDLPPNVEAALAKTEAETAAYTGPQLIICLSYGGRTEIAQAARRIAEDVKNGILAPEQVDEAAIAARLYLPDVPDPDLIIRTSGEQRISNFLLWQCAYSEFVFLPEPWPEFTEDSLQRALDIFASRNRRFGGIVDSHGSSVQPAT